MTAGQPPLTITIPAEQQAQLQTFVEKLEAVRNKRGLKLTTPGGTQAVAIPQVLLPLLSRAAEILANGDSLSLMPIEEEVTTQTAAEMLNISRQYLVRLLESGEIPYRKTGAHRRVHIQDVLTYRKKRG